MIQKLLKSFRKFVCSKLKTYKRNRYRAIQQPPPPPMCCTTDLKECAPNPPKTKKHHTIKEIREQNVCFNQGEYTRNPFFNFLREYRKTHCGLTIVEQAIQAGAEWRCMTNEEKCRYVVATDGKPQRRRRYKRRSIYWIKRSKISV